MNNEKAELRKEIRKKKAGHSTSELSALSDIILSLLEEQVVFQIANTILLYESLPDEVQTQEFIKKWSKSKQIILPVVVGDILRLRMYEDEKSMKTGAYGIKEPMGKVFSDFGTIDLAIVPGMAFDKEGHRLGRGKGYYDKLLPQIATPKIGICFPFQLVDKVPIESQDVKMDFIITQKLY
ncbi:MAG: 5-formyltetrahydrofolate cyclo-ligase [Bacteroidaceae bacterium]|nr:5-formyltetrahydrofolate cyclo-ligase [Bacteroidaceae bacterium]